MLTHPPEKLNLQSTLSRGQRLNLVSSICSTDAACTFYQAASACSSLDEDGLDDQDMH